MNIISPPAQFFSVLPVTICTPALFYLVKKVLPAEGDKGHLFSKKRNFLRRQGENNTYLISLVLNLALPRKAVKNH